MAVLKKNTASDLLKVNLLIHKGDQTKLYIRLFRWILSSGRFIVVIVELVVIGAFIMRYKLDSELIDLQEKIKEQVPYIQSLQQDETTIRQTQFQLTTIKQTKAEGLIFSAALVKIASLTPKNIKLTGITIDRTQSFPKTTLFISGQTPSNRELSAFIQLLQKDPAFSEISLTNISFEGQTIFTISGSLTGRGLQNS